MNTYGAEFETEDERWNFANWTLSHDGVTHLVFRPSWRTVLLSCRPVFFTSVILIAWTFIFSSDNINQGLAPSTWLKIDAVAIGISCLWPILTACQKITLEQTGHMLKVSRTGFRARKCEYDVRELEGISFGTQHHMSLSKRYNGKATSEQHRYWLWYVRLEGSGGGRQRKTVTFHPQKEKNLTMIPGVLPARIELLLQFILQARPEIALDGPHFYATRSLFAGSHRGERRLVVRLGSEDAGSSASEGAIFAMLAPATIKNAPGSARFCHRDEQGTTRHYKGLEDIQTPAREVFEEMARENGGPDYLYASNNMVK